MNDNDLKRIVDDRTPLRDDEPGLMLSMISEFYSRRMFAVAALTWAWALLFIAVGVFVAVMFFYSTATQDHVMYATIFVTSMLFLVNVKIAAGQMLHRHGVKREIKRLELRIAELTELMQNK